MFMIFMISSHISLHAFSVEKMRILHISYSYHLLVWTINLISRSSHSWFYVNESFWARFFNINQSIAIRSTILTFQIVSEISLGPLGWAEIWTMHMQILRDNTDNTENWLWIWLTGDCPALLALPLPISDIWNMTTINISRSLNAYYFLFV